MATPNVTVSVVLMVGSTRGEIGTVSLPLTTTGVSAGDGHIDVSVQPDMPGFRANLAALLREAADAFESGEGDDRG
ncbi:MAG: hypothetical protein JWN52_3592 [Actinomycetia bacterium]|nr:hypothetical protein [Actinomycetes bacterium]